MAQLRQDYGKFQAANTSILVVGPEDARTFAEYWFRHDLPFIGLPDPGHQVLKLYGQEVSLFKLGRMPVLVVIDARGLVRYAHYGHSMRDIPPNDEVLAVLQRLNEER